MKVAWLRLDAEVHVALSLCVDAVSEMLTARQRSCQLWTSPAVVVVVVSCSALTRIEVTEQKFRRELTQFHLAVFRPVTPTMISRAIEQYLYRHVLRLLLKLDCKSPH